MGKISHWLAAYGIAGEDFIRNEMILSQSVCAGLH